MIILPAILRIKYPAITFVLILLSGLFLISVDLHAQGRSYQLIYSDNIKGGTVIFGNTLMYAVDSFGRVDLTAMNDNAIDGYSIYGNDGFGMEPVDIDGNIGTGAGTKNSSSADLILPSGNNKIKMARLYWGGGNSNDTNNLSLPANRTIKIRKGTSGAYAEFSANQVDIIVKFNPPIQYEYYQAYVDITSYIQQNGAGTYTVGNIPLVSSNLQGVITGSFAGWNITVVYENDLLSFNNIRVYDGFSLIRAPQNPSSTVILNGLDVPSGALNAGDANVSVVTWEGDANIPNDYFKINGTTVSNAINPANNPWNGTISKNGVLVITKNPNYSNQMGIDIDEFDISNGYGIMPNATTVQLDFGTEQDAYLPSIFAFTIKMKEPSIALDKMVIDANANQVPEPGEILTYTLKGKNLGPGIANNVIVTDTLPSTITYLPNSIKVNYCPGIITNVLTDIAADDNGEFVSNGNIKFIKLRLGNNSNGSSGGSLNPLDSFEISFQTTVNIPVAGQPVPVIVNIARFTAVSETATNFVDDGIAILNPTGSPLPILLNYFNAIQVIDNAVKITWQTDMEINSEKYEIEKSSDGKKFHTIATLTAAGNASSTRSYSVIDQTNTLSESIIYYRLKQIDFDNTWTYSKTISVLINKSLPEVIVYPNPFQDKATIFIESNNNEQAYLDILNTIGEKIIRKNINLLKGKNNLVLNELKILPKGSYLLKLQKGEKILITRIIKR